MDDTQATALNLAVQIHLGRRQNKRLCPNSLLQPFLWEALCLAIEQTDAFKQEMSDVLEQAVPFFGRPSKGPRWKMAKTLSGYIIPKPDPDPITEMEKVWNELSEGGYDLHDFRAALEARGLEIREKGQ
jgi:hypothetical protein